MTTTPAQSASTYRSARWDAAADHLESLRTLRPAGVPIEIPEEDYAVPLGSFLTRWATERPEATAIHFYGRDITWRELDEQVGAVAGWLRAHGVTPGDRVAVFLSNCPQFIITMLATLRLGGVHVPVNPMFRERDLTHELADARPTVLVAQSDFAPLVTKVCTDTAEFADLTVVWTALGDVLTTSPIPAAPFDWPALATPTASDWAAMLSSSPVTAGEVTIDPHALAALNYTGGTTGLPKGCEHTQAHTVYTALSMHLARNHAPGTDRTPAVAVTFQPVFWIAGEDAVLSALVDGATLVLLNRWDPDAVIALVESCGATDLVGLADSFQEILDQPGITDRDLSSLTECTAISFVRKLDHDLRRDWASLTGAILRETSYGMTETHTVDTCTLGLQDNDRDLAGEPVYCGLPVPGTRILVVNGDLEPQPVGEPGQIIVSSPSVMTRYHQRPEATADALIDGWLLTGDTGHIDADGALTYLARTKDMIKTNGMSVFPAEVETILGEHPLVGTVAVAPREDAQRGQVPIAFILPNHDAPDARNAQNIARTLHEWASTQMAGYKVPEIIIVDAMPVTATGKIRKVELIDQLNAASHTASDNASAVGERA